MILSSSSSVLPTVKKKVLFQLPAKLKPVYYGTQGRILGILKYLNDRREFLSVDIVVANLTNRESYITPQWDAEQLQEVLKYADNVFVYEGRYNLFDFFYTRIKIFYYQVLLKQQLPIDTDYYSPPGYINFIRSKAIKVKYDFAWINTVNFTPLAKPFKSTPTVTIVDTHDITCRLRMVLKEIVNYKNLAFDYDLNFSKEVAALNKLDVVISDSNYEFSTLKNYLPTDKLYSIPTFVGDFNSGISKPYKDREFKYDLLFVGMSSPQNLEALNFFFESIFESILKVKPDTKLAIAGKVCSEIKFSHQFSDSTELLGYVDSLSDLYLQSRIVICPIRTGGGTNIKLIEAMSYSMPTVITQRCAAALFLENGINTFITDEPSQYAEYVLQLLMDFSLAERFSEAVECSYQKYYSKQAIYSQLDSLFGINQVNA